MDPTVIMLVIGLTTSTGPVRHEIPKNSVDACIEELTEFLHHKMPDIDSVTGMTAGCIIPKRPPEPEVPVSFNPGD